MLLFVFVALALAQPDSRVVRFPFYFGVPKEASPAVPCTQVPYPYFWNPSVQSSEVGLRLIAVPNGPSRAERQNARRTATKALAKSGMLRDGDIVLTFRPELQDSSSYPHIQMGVTHAGLVYTRTDSDGVNVVAMNIDSPLDSLYMGQFDSAHYAGDGAADAGTDFLHIVRPRNFGPEKRKQLREWIRLLMNNLRRINGERAQMKFQSDYLKPSFAVQQKSVRQIATQIGKIILEIDKQTNNNMFCSEFAYYMLALGSCTPDQIRNAGPNGADCVQPVFEPMNLISTSSSEVGLAEGPLIALTALNEKPGLVSSVFCSNGHDCVNGGKLSSGHRAVATAVAPLMAGVEQIYRGRIAGATAEMTAQGATQLNAFAPPNYSPTAMFVRSFSLGARAFEYIGTLYFHSARDTARIQAVAQAQCGGSPNAAVSNPVVPPRVVDNTQQCIRDAAEARRAQENLIFLKHLEAGQADGRWGPRSQRSLNAFQNQYRHRVTECLTLEAAQLLQAERARRG